MATPGRRNGWRKKDQRETVKISPRIGIEIHEWLKTQDNQAATIEQALIEYREKLEEQDEQYEVFANQIEPDGGWPHE